MYICKPSSSKYYLNRSNAIPIQHQGNAKGLRPWPALAIAKLFKLLKLLKLFDPPSPPIVVVRWSRWTVRPPKSLGFSAQILSLPKMPKKPKNAEKTNFSIFYFNHKERLNLRDSLEQASSYSYSPSFTLSRLQTIATILPFHSISYKLLSLSLTTKVFLHEIRSISLRERIVV